MMVKENCVWNNYNCLSLQFKDCPTTKYAIYFFKESASESEDSDDGDDLNCWSLTVSELLNKINVIKYKN